jgi:aryl-alcohol dehydrogenase-like predicted oxidoreductase
VGQQIEREARSQVPATVGHPRGATDALAIAIAGAIGQGAGAPRTSRGPIGNPPSAKRGILHNMQKRRLGNSPLEIAPLVFGGNVFGWTADEATSFRLLDSFVAAGFDCIDTADVYSKWVPGHRGGESETIIGKWLKLRGGRGKLVIATKVGMEMPGIGQGLAKDYIGKRVEDSLRRLNTDYIDLYQSHCDDASTPFEETLGVYQRLIEQGKVRAIGASNIEAPRLAAALKASATHGLPRYECLQPLYNLSDRASFEAELAALCVRENVGVIPYYSLAAGFLTGKYRSPADFAKSPRGVRMPGYLDARGKRILDALDEVSARLRAKPAQVALAWLIEQPAVTAPIASASHPDQLQDLYAATRLKLDDEAQVALTKASAAQS